MKSSFFTIQCDEQGRLVLPADAAARLGIRPGATVRLREDGAGLRIAGSTERLARIYIEPTSACNLACSMCIRSAWKETPGQMARETFSRLIASARSLQRMPSFFFGGYGEPLLHPDILWMLEEAKGLGAEVELITNATLLGQETAERLVEIGLDRIWVSLDATEDEAFAALRGGGILAAVTENLSRLFAARESALAECPRIGISFVARRETIAGLPEVLRLGKRFGVDRFVVSNVLPHTPELQDQTLYQKSHYEPDLPASAWAPLVELPRMEVNRLTQSPLVEVMRGLYAVSIAGQRIGFGSCTCPFVDRGCTVVRWDGAVSPCLPLLHSHVEYLGERRREIDAFTVGSLSEGRLTEIWAEAPYAALRRRLAEFDFAPCTICNSCENADSNREDCIGNTAPACGGCLWAQGFIQCP